MTTTHLYLGLDPSLHGTAVSLVYADPLLPFGVKLWGSWIVSIDKGLHDYEAAVQMATALSLFASYMQDCVIPPDCVVSGTIEGQHYVGDRRGMRAQDLLNLAIVSGAAVAALGPALQSTRVVLPNEWSTIKKQVRHDKFRHLSRWDDQTLLTHTRRLHLADGGLVQKTATEGQMKDLWDAVGLARFTCTGNKQ